jgi:hypothetical protein
LCTLLVPSSLILIGTTMIKQITLNNFNYDDTLTIGEIILDQLDGIEDFNHDQYQLSWEIIVTRDTYK